MPSTNFLQFDPQAVNMMDDETYSGDAQRVSGVSTGLARSLLYNKQAFQASTMVRAIANVMVNNGQNAMDNNLTSLTNNLQATFITSGANNTFTGTNTFSGSIALNGTISGSNSAKETLNGWGMIDFEAPIDIGSGYQTTSNGFLYLRASANSRRVIVYINGIQVFLSSWGADYGSPDQCYIPVSKGSTITYDVNNENRLDHIFYPCFGG